jgi:hypothetical protein
MTNDRPSSATSPARRFGTLTVNTCEREQRIHIEGDHHVVAELDVSGFSGGELEELRSLAHVFAAGPDLLEACQLLVRSLGDWMEIADEEDIRADDEEAMLKGVAAIAKAKGA